VIMVELPSEVSEKKCSSDWFGPAPMPHSGRAAGRHGARVGKAKRVAKPGVDAENYRRSRKLARPPVPSMKCCEIGYRAVAATMTIRSGRSETEAPEPRRGDAHLDDCTRRSRAGILVERRRFDGAPRTSSQGHLRVGSCRARTVALFNARETAGAGHLYCWNFGGRQRLDWLEGSEEALSCCILQLRLSVGEVKFLRGPGPSQIRPRALRSAPAAAHSERDEFPYTVRLSLGHPGSNGSPPWPRFCGGSLS